MNYYAHGESDGRVLITYGDDVEPGFNRVKVGHPICRMRPENVRPLAAELLAAAGKGNIGLTVVCPLCYQGLITIQYDPGYPQRNYMPNGDPGYPGEPPSIEGIDATCGCWSQERQATIFGMVEIEEWKCPACHLWNRGFQCSPLRFAGCGRLRSLFQAPLETRKVDEPHPVYVLLEALVAAIQNVGEYYAAEAEAAFFAQAELEEPSAEMVDAAINAAIHEAFTAERLAALERSATEPREYCAQCGADTTDQPIGPCAACGEDQV